MGGESFATGDRHLQINPFETTASTSQAVEQAPGDQSISLLGSQLLEIDALPQTEDHHIYRSTPSTLSDSAISTRVVQGTLPVTPSAHP
ncbi:uncharacterized protein LOC123876365 isoform X2 [Maniola jurtina]|uniref:uncharacterized protein LOC123876365 isoform X2 n=1 Tax=Maniola jurtina TaxID=191418 RepID=UPI001E686CA2|nr:uncharacterized protein LOC123876365 isoform X2 [Maniola jurtina]